MRYFVFILLLTLFTTLSAKSLSGKWVANSGSQKASLEFVSQNQLRYNREMLYYQIVGSNIRVADEYFGYVEYPYTLKKKTLYVTFPEGYTLKFQHPKKVKQKTQQRQNSGKDTYLLRGRLCSYSSSYNGGYSHSDRLYFDGNGRYSTGEQSYSSGDAGNYVNEGSSSDGGSYSVSGVNVYVRVDGGNSFSGKVTQRASNGAITGIEVNGKIFATGLCD